MNLKKGDQPIATELQRSGVGLRINVRTHPVIEEFMRGVMGTPEPTIEPVEAFGRNWQVAKGESRRDLQVYAIPRELSGIFTIAGGISYRLDRPGQPIFVGNQPTPDDGLRATPPRGSAVTNILNLSFLRLVGSSEESGVTFHIPGIYSENTMDELERSIGASMREIYNQFMKPIKITITQEVRNAEDDRELVVEVAPPPDDGPLTFAEAVTILQNTPTISLDIETPIDPVGVQSALERLRGAA